MKRINNIYNTINDIDVIMDMYDNVISKNTKNKNKIEKFNDYYSSNIINIKNIINSKNYIPGEYNIFLIHEPKLRIIMSQSIKDKIINHLVAKYFLVNFFDKSLIETNIATRIGKGTHYGIKLTKKYLNKMKNKYDNNFYYLKFDINKYFFNIDHSIVKNIVRTKIKDKDVLNIIDSIIDSTDENYINKNINMIINNEINKINKSKLTNKQKIIKINEIKNIPLYKKGYGFPIGNMTSQIIAITYLNNLDHFIKENLKIKYYIRYMDDGVLLHQNKDYLIFCKQMIEEYLSKYNLIYNKNKTIINKIKEGLDFIGFVFMINNKKVILKVRSSTKIRFKRKIKKNNNSSVIMSYIGHLKYGNCRGLLFKSRPLF